MQLPCFPLLRDNLERKPNAINLIYSHSVQIANIFVNYF